MISLSNSPLLIISNPSIGISNFRRDGRSDVLALPDFLNEANSAKCALDSDCAAVLLLLPLMCVFVPAVASAADPTAQQTQVPLRPGSVRLDVPAAAATQHALPEIPGEDTYIYTRIVAVDSLSNPCRSSLKSSVSSACARKSHPAASSFAAHTLSASRWCGRPALACTPLTTASLRMLRNLGSGRREGMWGGCRYTRNRSRSRFCASPCSTRLRLILTGNRRGRTAM